MLKFKKWLIRLSMAAAPVIAVFALSAPAVTQAATTIVVDDVTTADNCGTYDGDTAETDPLVAIAGAPNGATVVICPGTYALTGSIPIDNLTKLTIKRALTDMGDSPVLVADPSVTEVFDITNSTGITIDGLIIDGTSNTVMFYSAIHLDDSGLTLKNTGIIGPDTPDGSGVYADASGQTKVKTVSITDCYIVGFYKYGVYARGAVKLTVTSTQIDGTDGGRVGGASSGVLYDGLTTDTVTPTGTVKDSRIAATVSGVSIYDTSKVTVSNNIILTSTYGVSVRAFGTRHNADNNKVTGNTILNVPAAGEGIYVVDADAAAFSIKKLTISNNTIVSATFLPGGTPPTGIHVEADVLATRMVTLTVSGNTFMGFSAGSYLENVSDFAGVTEKTSTYLP